MTWEIVIVPVKKIDANYVLRASTTVFLNDAWVPLDIATSAGRMQEYIEQALASEGTHEGS